MSTDTERATSLHGGRLVARRLKAHGVTKLFTLSGGHLFSIYDGCREEGIDLVDVRHEQAAAFAAEGWAKATRTPGVCALTAGPGGTTFVDFPLDQVFMEADPTGDGAAALPDPASLPPAPDIAEAAELLRSA